MNAGLPKAAPSGDRPDTGCWITAALVEHESRLIRYVIGLVGDINIAREIVQDVFLRLCASQREQVEPHLASWLFRVSRNAAIDHLRKEKRMQTMDLNGIDQLVGSDRDSQVGPLDSDSMVRSEANASVMCQLQRLSPNHQEVIRLRFENQLSYKQIAEITGRTTSSVGFMIHTAIKKLRKALVGQNIELQPADVRPARSVNEG